MATGLHAVNVANKWLDWLRGTAITAPTGMFLKLHISDPGAAAANGPSAVVTRNTLTMAAASGGAISLTTLAAYAMTTSETISHFSVWDASSAGNPLFTGQLTASKLVANGDSLTFTALGVSLTPLMA
jgi:hypothetical protein